MKVLVYGSVNIDMVFSVDHIILPGETIKSKKMTRSAGGKGANQAVALAKAGSSVWFAGKAGNDASWIVSIMDKAGVNTEYLCHTEHANGQTVIQLDRNRQNAIITLAGANGEIEESEIDSVLTHFEEGDCLVLQNEIPHLAYLLEKGEEKGMYIVLNPSPMTDDIATLPLEKVNLLVVNEIEGAALAQMDTDADFEVILAALEAKLPDTEIVMTVGARGAYYRFQGDMYFSTGTKVKAVDTTGAGDTFLGYFLTYRNEKRDIDNCLSDSCFAAGIAVSRPGAMQSIPSRSEVDG